MYAYILYTIKFINVYSYVIRIQKRTKYLVSIIEGKHVMCMTRIVIIRFDKMAQWVKARASMPD